jgi:hypothetical protein
MDDIDGSNESYDTNNIDALHEMNFLYEHHNNDEVGHYKEEHYMDEDSMT